MRLVKCAVKSALAVIVLSISANATFWDVEAVAGSYGPVALGDSIQLDGCGSNLRLVGNTSTNFSICNLSDRSNFSLTWFARNNDTNAFSFLTDPIAVGNEPFGTFDTNSSFTALTGAGSFFNTVGSYAIGVYVSVRNSIQINVSGINANTGGDVAQTSSQLFGSNGDLNNGAQYTSNFNVTEPVITSVPEPEAIFLLLPALAVIARRQRRRRAEFAPR